MAVICPNCQQQGKVPHDAAGNRVKCPKCQECFIASPPLAPIATKESESKQPSGAPEAVDSTGDQAARPAIRVQLGKPPTTSTPITGDTLSDFLALGKGCEFLLWMATSISAAYMLTCIEAKRLEDLRSLYQNTFYTTGFFTLAFALGKMRSLLTKTAKL